MKARGSASKKTEMEKERRKENGRRMKGEREKRGDASSNEEEGEAGTKERARERERRREFVNLCSAGWRAIIRGKEPVEGEGERDGGGRNRVYRPFSSPPPCAALSRSLTLAPSPSTPP
jgi:hypothetical protein